MGLSASPRSKALCERVAAFMREHVYPNEALFEQQLHELPDEPFRVPPILETLKAKARAEGLWNLFLPDSEHGAGLTNLEYAPIAEVMGRVIWASEVFNCSAPDSGNIEVLDRYGSPLQKRKYLIPLLEGRIRSSYCMTEPDVASSDATNIETRIQRDGDDYVINGRKWWITNAYHPNNRLYIVMGKTDPSAPLHRQQSQIIVDPDTPGITLVRPLAVFGYHDEPKGHAEIVFENVRVPAENLILGEGRGFEISQGRLGPGRIHHCMRIVGQCERLLEKVCRRLVSRTAFGKALAEQSLWQERIAQARTELNMVRLLTHHVAHLMDTVGNKQARSEIAQIKVAATRVGQSIADMAIQAFGAAGLCDDEGLGFAFARMRMIRIADGPDEVHNRTIAREELRKYQAERAAAAG
ncbi:MAG: acyl-CoA dehydrogenase family protein [Aromatoleum sp.]|jgi:acyl-CoA dehydrogenase|uniref:acyl-CoA dehydrogenase family protein n=1 Tax=Aromatoleum sp. TaxID=2307007 RepID=UPI002895C206|nr:acyl-CoA dehydrogenase family protein [Aromatoleum sp.]MDT3670197.1 acyl-CoA dehydrogenase family protein [Aromatoleum sp.]